MEVYVWLWNNYKLATEVPDVVAAFLTLASFIEKQGYPQNAKYNLMLEGIIERDQCRVSPETVLTATSQSEVRQLRSLTNFLNDRYLITT